MKNVLLLSAAFSLAAAGAFAQVLDIDAPLFAEPKAAQTFSLSPVIQLYIDDSVDGSMPAVSQAIAKELDRSTYLDLVTAPAEAAHLKAPTKITLPKKDNGDMKVAYQITFWRGGQMDLYETCAPTKPDECARALRTRLERLIREHQRLIGASQQ